MVTATLQVTIDLSAYKRSYRHPSFPGMPFMFVLWCGFAVPASRRREIRTEMARTLCAGANFNCFQTWLVRSNLYV